MLNKLPTTTVTTTSKFTCTIYCERFSRLLFFIASTTTSKNLCFHLFCEKKSVLLPVLTIHFDANVNITVKRILNRKSYAMFNNVEI